MGKELHSWNNQQHKKSCTSKLVAANTLRPRQNGRLFADDTVKRIFLNENIRISIRISLKFVPKGLINNIPALVLIMTWRRPGHKPLTKPMMVRSLTHICVKKTPVFYIAPWYWRSGNDDIIFCEVQHVNPVCCQLNNCGQERMLLYGPFTHY